jgi:hypothetical protein
VIRFVSNIATLYRRAMAGQFGGRNQFTTW